LGGAPEKGTNENRAACKITSEKDGKKMVWRRTEESIGGKEM